MKKYLHICLALLLTVSMLLAAPARLPAYAASDHKVEPYKIDWLKNWDANQNNAYIDIINGLYDMDDTVSLKDDYITGEQFFNVMQRVMYEHTYWDIVVLNHVNYDENGYVESAEFRYDVRNIPAEPDEIKTKLHGMADAAAFGKSFIDDTMTDYEKALFCHDFIDQRTYYKLSENDTFGASSEVFLEHYGQCYNIYSAYNALLNYAQVPCTDIGGYNHGWTVLGIDGKWYVSDATFDAGGNDYDWVKYQSVSHQFFFCGINRHLEDHLHSSYMGYDIVDQLEYNDSREYWTLKDYIGRLAYHVNEGEPHGLIYYLDNDPASGAYVLTTRDSLKLDANIVYYPESEYSNIAWGNDTLFGYRDNAVYIIDWNTHEETLVARLEDNKLCTYDADGALAEEHALTQEEGEITGLASENNGIYAKVSYPDLSWEEFKVFSYDEIKFEPVPMSEKVALSGPSAEPGEVIYNLTYCNFPNLSLTIVGTTDSFYHPDGYAPADNLNGIWIGGIGDSAFKDLGPERLGGKLELPETYRTIWHHAFENCTGLSGDLDLSNVWDVYDCAFMGCTGLDGKVTFYPERGLYPSIFEGCTGIKSLEGISGNNFILNNAFKGCTSLTGRYDLSETSFINDDAFNGCTGIEIEPDLTKADRLGHGAFRGCEGISGPISIPNCKFIGLYALTGTNITEVNDTDNVETIYGPAFNGKLTGILSLPSLKAINGCPFLGENDLTAIRIGNPDAVLENKDLMVFPDTTDVAMFVVKGSEVEDVIKQRWTYGVNYWYVDDVLASGVLDDAVSWEILGDGTMNFTDASAASGQSGDSGQSGVKKLFSSLRSGAKGHVVISVPEGESAPWDEYKKYVETVCINSENLCVGEKAISGFENLEKVELIEGATYEEGAFEDCGDLSVDDIETVDACKHEFGDWEEVQAATCTEPGTLQRTCSICGKVETKETKPNGHAEKVLFSVAATCTQTGLTQGVTCEVCGADIIPQKVTPALGHREVVLAGRDATCTAPGLTEGKKCSACGEVFVEQEVIPALGHDFGEWVTVTEPTEEAEGLEKRTCSRCGKEESQEIPVLTHTHNLQRTAAKAATCTEAGNIEYWTCSKCGKIYSDEEATTEITEEETVVEAFGHNWDEATYEWLSNNGTVTATRKCKNDASHEETEAVNATSSVTKQPTCEEKGETTYVAVFRNSAFETQTKTIANIDALGHAWGDWVIVTEPTEEAEGLEKRTCSRCGEEESRAIPALSHTHNLQRTAAKAATCTEAGNIEYWKCSKCGKFYSDEEAKNEITEAETIVKATGHTEVAIPGKAATCTETGLTEGKKCSACGKILVAQEEIPVLGHAWGEWVTVTEPTEEAEGLEKRTCSRCGAEESRAIPALSHTHNLQRTAAKAATCTEAGNIEYWTCSKCGKFYSDEEAKNEITETETIVKATGHKETVISGKAATCTETGLTEGKKCSVCGEILVAQTEIPALGHDYGEWTVTTEATCTEDGEEQRVCSRDKTHIEKRTIKAAGHTEVAIPGKDASCTEAGLTEGKNCSVCGEILVAQTEIPALGHAWGEWITVTEPTEEAEGLETRACGRCSVEESRPIPKLNHVHDLVKTDALAATCTADGNIEYWTCSKCGRFFIDEKAENEVNEEDVIIKTLGHTEEIIPAVAPTYTETGLTEGKKCSVCGEILLPQEEIPMLERTSIEGATVSGIKTKVYTGKTLTQAPTVVLGGTTLKAGTDYELTYSKNKNVGTATVTITGVNAYKDSISKTFKINPKATSMVSASALSKGFTAKWKKLTTQTTGYQLQYSTSSSFKSGNKTVTITKNSTVTKKVTKLKANKKYYVRVRTYKTVSGTKYYSAWSAKKAVTTKK